MRFIKWFRNSETIREDRAEPPPPVEEGEEISKEEAARIKELVERINELKVVYAVTEGSLWDLSWMIFKEPEDVISKATLLEKYDLLDGEYKVAIYLLEGNGYYIISEDIPAPYVIDLANVVGEVIRRTGLDVSEENLMDTVKYVVDMLKLIVNEDELRFIYHYIYKLVNPYQILYPLFKDYEVEEITVPDRQFRVFVRHRRHPDLQWLTTNIEFPNKDALNSYIQRLSLASGKSISPSNPYVEARAPDGSRLTLVYGEEVSAGPSLTVRKYPEVPWTIIKLIAVDAITPEAAAYLWILHDAKGVLLIAGPMASGKTTLLNALLMLTDPRKKIVTLEETPELNIPHPIWQRMYTREVPFYTELKPVTLWDLARWSLRTRGDYVVIGEARGEEIIALVQQSLFGTGALTTIHATSPQDLIHRLLSPPMNLPEYWLSSIWSIVQLRSIGGWRGVTEIIEMDQEGKMVKVFERRGRPGSLEPLVDPTKTYRMKLAASLLIIGEKIKEEFEKRVNFLLRMYENKIDTYDKLKIELAKFYAEESVIR